MGLRKLGCSSTEHGIHEFSMGSHDIAYRLQFSRSAKVNRRAMGESEETTMAPAMA
jgi:hypothetical protein